MDLKKEHFLERWFQSVGKRSDMAKCEERCESKDYQIKKIVLKRDYNGYGR